MTRRIYPIVATVTADGYQRLSDSQAGGYAESVVAGRMTEPDGPPAALREAAGPPPQ
jgi:proteasome beta subunit